MRLLFQLARLAVHRMRQLTPMCMYVTFALDAAVQCAPIAEAALVVEIGWLALQALHAVSIWKRKATIHRNQCGLCNEVTLISNAVQLAGHDGHPLHRHLKRLS